MLEFIEYDTGEKIFINATFVAMLKCKKPDVTAIVFSFGETIDVRGSLESVQGILTVQQQRNRIQ